MNLLSVIIVLVIIGILMYLINAFIPMDSSIKRILNVVVIVFLVIWMMTAFGLMEPLSTIKIGK
mgnify:CR=1 FL=1